MTWYNPLTWFSSDKPEFKRWPTRTVTYCFRQKPTMKRGVMPQEYRDVAIEAAQEWTDKTVINLELKDFYSNPQPDIVISMRDLPKKCWVGWGYFPGKTALSGDIDIDYRDWLGKHSKQYLKTIILHEFGHALGIEKHSRYYKSIMYATPKAKEIHRFDIKNLNEGYEKE